MNSYRKKNKAVMLIGMLLPVALWLSSCSISDPNHSHDQDEEARSSFRYQLDADGATQFSIRGINGDIEITGETSTDSIEVRGERIVRSDDFSDAEVHLELLKVEVQQTGSEIAVHTDQPSRSEGRSYEVVYHVRLPRSMVVKVQLVNGTVAVEKISGSLQVESTNGNVDCREILGDCEVALVNGQIECDVVLPIEGSCGLTTVNGNIILAIPDTTSSQLEAKLTNGSVSISGLQIKNMVSSRTSVSGTLGNGGGSIQLTTVNGNIEVQGKDR